MSDPPYPPMSDYAARLVQSCFGRMRIQVLSVLLGVLVLAPACSSGGDKSSSSVLNEGVRVGQGAKRRVITADEARRASRLATANWKGELKARAREDPETRFDNLDSAVLRSRLDDAASKYDFTVVSFDLLRPRQVAPRIVVKTKRYLELAHATPAILRRLDPKRPTLDDWTGWRYEGFYFEAQDEDGVPFLTVVNYWRGSGAGGGQWARSERLFPARLAEVADEQDSGGGAV